MKPKHLVLAVAALLAAVGLWLSRAPGRAEALDKSSLGARSKTARGRNSEANSATSLPKASQPGPDAGPNSTNAGRILRPPDPSRLFREFTPEERVKFARKGHGPGG